MNLILYAPPLQNTTPDTSSYMIAGYAVIFIIMLIYLASLSIRQRNFRKDLELLEELEEKNKESSLKSKM